MNYISNYKQLKHNFSKPDAKVEFDGYEILKCDFHSKAHTILPGAGTYQCHEHDSSFSNYFFVNDIGMMDDAIVEKDSYIDENQNFSYHILKPKGQTTAQKVTFLFHGFNEKYWDKYLPWGQAICEQTQSAVVFFPIAFHMQRAPHRWSERRKMFELSEERRKQFPNIINSTLSNVAISMRLHYMPERFIWSGLQTYYDVIQFIEECKAGTHPYIAPDFSFNIFAYSIGGLLAEILKLSNHKNYFSDSKICLFCSGAVFNRLSPVSKYILDSEANVALYSYMVEHFDSILKKDPFLHHFIEESHLEGKVFHSMLEFLKMREFREGLFKKYETQIYAITLKKDTVIPSLEVINTLNGAYRNINIKVDEFDFDFDYSHENPFPINLNEGENVNESFKMIFQKVCHFLNH